MGHSPNNSNFGLSRYSLTTLEKLKALTLKYLYDPSQISIPVPEKIGIEDCILWQPSPLAFNITSNSTALILAS